MNTIFTNWLKMRIIFIFCLVYSFCGCTKEIIRNDLGSSFKYQPSEIAPGIELGSIYSSNNFTAFTDIVNYNNTWYVIFRAGTQHLGGLNGQIKILKSTDAINWTVDHIIENDSLDLRDPKFILDTINNELYINYLAALGLPTSNDTYHVHNFILTYNSNDGYSKPLEITDDQSGDGKFAFWRITYNKGKMYSAAFHVPVLGGYTNDNICLFNNNNDYKNYTTIGKLNLGSSPDESTIRFDANDNMYFLIRRETANVALGYSSPANYCNVTWVTDPLSIRLASPNFLFYNGKLLISGRDQDKLNFKLFSYNLATNKIEKEFTFPSGVETGYSGMSFNPTNKDELFISYYVITHRNSYIYLAKVDLKTFLQ